MHCILVSLPGKVPQQYQVAAPTIDMDVWDYAQRGKQGREGDRGHVP